MCVWCTIEYLCSPVGFGNDRGASLWPRSSQGALAVQILNLTASAFAKLEAARAERADLAEKADAAGYSLDTLEKAFHENEKLREEILSMIPAASSDTKLAELLLREELATESLSDISVGLRWDQSAAAPVGTLKVPKSQKALAALGADVKRMSLSWVGLRGT